jgi:hypothetical protein
MEAQYEKIANIDGLEVTVGYNISGEHRPATHEDPEEYPEVEIMYYKVNDVDIEHLFTAKALKEIEESINFFDLEDGRDEDYEEEY